MGACTACLGGCRLGFCAVWFIMSLRGCVVLVVLFYYFYAALVFWMGFVFLLLGGSSVIDLFVVVCYVFVVVRWLVVRCLCLDVSCG